MRNMLSICLSGLSAAIAHILSVARAGAPSDSRVAARQCAVAAARATQLARFSRREHRG